MSEITAQSIFDTTVRHLRTMRRPSRRLMRCAYRGHDGDRCAVGVHLTDKECHLPEETGHLYVDQTLLASVGPTLDALGISDVLYLVEQNLLPERLVPHAKLLAALQVVHDKAWLWKDKGGGIDVDRARKHLLENATFYKLDPAVVIDLY